MDGNEGPGSSLKEKGSSKVSLNFSSDDGRDSFEIGLCLYPLTSQLLNLCCRWRWKMDYSGMKDEQPQGKNLRNPRHLSMHVFRWDSSYLMKNTKQPKNHSSFSEVSWKFSFNNLFHLRALAGQVRDQCPLQQVEMIVPCLMWIIWRKR